MTNKFKYMPKKWRVEALQQANDLAREGKLHDANLMLKLAAHTNIQFYKPITITNDGNSAN